MEAPLTEQIWQVHQNQQVVVLGVGSDWSTYSCEGWVNAFGITYPMLDDSDSEIYSMFGDGYVPYNVIIDHQGIVLYAQSGFNSGVIINIISEALLEQSVEYLLLTKIGKYTQSKFVQKQNTDIHLMPNIGNKNIWKRDMMPLKYGYLYRGGRSPHKRISTDAIYKTSFFVDRLKEFIPKSREDWTKKRIDWTDSNAGMKYFGPRIPFTDIQQPNFYEGYYDFHNGMKRFSDMKCYVPRKEVFIEYIDVLQKEERFENK